MWQACYNQNIGNLGFFYHNLKHKNSINLMTIAGPDYECLNAKIGSHFMVNDGRVWGKNRLLQPVDGWVKLPVHDKLTESDQVTLHVFLGYDVFTLKLYMMKAYPQQ